MTRDIPICTVFLMNVPSLIRLNPIRKTMILSVIYHLQIIAFTCTSAARALSCQDDLVP